MFPELASWHLLDSIVDAKGKLGLCAGDLCTDTYARTYSCQPWLDYWLKT